MRRAERSEAGRIGPRAERDGPTVELRVPAGAAGQRLDTWLAEAIGAESRTVSQRLIEAELVRVDGHTQPKGFRLEGGERVTTPTALPERPVEPIDLEPEVAWEDSDLMIVDKPAGLVVHPAPGHRASTLVELLAKRGRRRWRPLVVHRLDRDTSGLMLVAKNASMQRRVREMIRAREVEREYMALVKGRMDAVQGTIEAPLGRDARRRERMSTRTAKPRPAVTHFTVERFLGGFTLVRARLETGRTHQIRVHFAEIGHPVCGDRTYGGAGLLDLQRQFLHSARIALPHPVSGQRLEQSSTLPEDLALALRGLEEQHPHSGESGGDGSDAKLA